ncbi:hypothetical protein ACLMMQ_29970 [Bacillus mobilis]|uniref:hypothetical protein n=1 Tax=Bacillati TaxID=1783272 RepID=UPI0037141ED4
MAQASENTSGAGNTAVPKHGDHDRVAMLSLRADGSPDQLAPEMIGDKEFAREATRRQFQEQAVSAADVAERGVTADTGAEEVGQDPEIEKLQKVHEKAAGEAESAADATVNALFTDDPQLTTGTEVKPAARSTATAADTSKSSKNSSTR